MADVQTGRQVMESAVTRFFHMCNSHCPGNLAPLLTADVELTADQHLTGSEAVNAYFVQRWGNTDLTYRVENILIDGTTVVAETTYRNGPQGEGRQCFVFQMKADLIRRIRMY